MRPHLFVISAFSLLCALTPLSVAHAQYGGGGGGAPGGGGPGGGGGGGGDSQDDAKKQRLDREMQTQALLLPPVTADGPCPYVKILYDAARTISFKDNKQASGNVIYSGELEGLVADCSYKDADPIKVQTNITFLFGKGPQAPGPKTTFTYWVAVTDRDKAVLDKQYFTIDVLFSPGVDRVIDVQKIQDILIPRAAKTVSGDNFEVLIGFDVTPEQAAFNRQGARFRVNATGEAAATPASGTPTAQ
jgi:hypothetical protein